ncbi:ribose-phosphate diphosphokinase [Apilactobacillus xinyiensis]|uniref:ribose-phosphate diphosphokinase n=1 Tax=Apilactobacillus xinyiensis TaxID=2841032 RepID=UPI003570C420
MMDKQDSNNLKLFTLNSNKELANKISSHLNILLGKATINHFSDGEIKITIDESIRGDEVYIIQSLSDPINTNIMELMIMVDAVRRTSAKSINVVIPYYSYSRSVNKNRSRQPIVVKMLASLFENAGVTRVITLDLHSPQIQGFFDIPVDHLKAEKLLAKHLEHHYDLSNSVVVSLDYDGVARARSFAGLINQTIAIIDNRDPNNLENIPTSIIGDVNGKDVIVVDDIVDSGVKSVMSADVLKEHGAKSVSIVSTHPVLSGNASDRINDSQIDHVVLTDSIFIPEEKMNNKLDVVSVSGLFADAIKLINENKSVGHLFR